MTPKLVVAIGSDLCLNEVTPKRKSKQMIIGNQEHITVTAKNAAGETIELTGFYILENGKRVKYVKVNERAK